MHMHRLAKEKIMYEKEVVDQEAKIEKMKAENKDEYDIKKQVYKMHDNFHKLITRCIGLDIDVTSVLSSRLKFFKNPRTWCQTAKED